MTAVLERPAAVRPGPPLGEVLPARGSLLALAMILVAETLIATDARVPVVRPIAGVGVIVLVPTWLLVAKVRWGAVERSARFIYSVTTSVLGALVLGLAANTLLPMVGLDRPLNRWVVVSVSGAADVALLFWRPRVPLLPERSARQLMARAAGARFEPLPALACTALVCCVLGAIRLNNGLGSTLTIVGLILVGVCFVMLLTRSEHSTAQDACVLVILALAMLLATSLRGWYITGHDIQREYLVYLLTHVSEHWQMAAFRDPYNACLSITILPSVLVTATGMSGILVFKLVLQLLFALVPVQVYLWGRRLMGRRCAVLGTLIFCTFPTFFTDMPYLVRQEVAFLFLGAMLLAATEKWHSRAAGQVACLTFGVGVVISHYATTYLLLATLVLGASGLYLMAAGRHLTGRIGRHRPPSNASRPRPILLAPLTVLGLLLLTWTWTVPATHSGGHALGTLHGAVSDVLSGDSQAGSSDLGYGLVHRRQLTAQQRLDRYAAQTDIEGRQSPQAEELVSLHGRSESQPRIAPMTDLPLTAIGRAIQSIGLDVHGVNTLLRAGAAALLQLFVLAGLAALVTRRRAVPVPREPAWLALGSVGGLAVLVLVPNLSVEYGVLRAFQQVLLVASPVAALGAVTLVRPLRRWAFAAAATTTVVLYFSLSGVVPTATGGYPAQLALSNSGQYYDLYYITQPEVAAVTWLGGVSRLDPVASEVVSDRYTVRRIRRYLTDSTSTNDEFFPTQLHRDEYVFVGQETVQKGIATVNYQGDLLSYRYPTRVLDQQFDLIYSNGSARVYR